VSDNGPGIPPDMIDTVLEPFVTTKETGTGLGLSICQRIATAHQGQMQVRNRPAGGAELTVLLPYGL
jgi:signal transduction histidine kinase